MADNSNQFSDETFWEKVVKFAKDVGRDLIVQVLTIYHCMLDPDTPMPTKIVAIGALAYFIFPFDLIPDMIITLGYADDLVAIRTALPNVTVYFKDEHREQAETAAKELFD